MRVNYVMLFLNIFQIRSQDKCFFRVCLEHCAMANTGRLVTVKVIS